MTSFSICHVEVSEGNAVGKCQLRMTVGREQDGFPIMFFLSNGSAESGPMDWFIRHISQEQAGKAIETRKIDFT